MVCGGALNVYYYLGYWMFGCLGIVTGVPSNIVFNLALPTIFGLAAVNLYATGTLLLDKFRWLPLTILLIPNPSFFYQIVQGKALNTVLWDSTRTIANTINEYPLFSFFWGDVHAHVVSIFNQVFLIFLLLYAWKQWESLEDRAKWLVSILCALSWLNATVQYLGCSDLRPCHAFVRGADHTESKKEKSRYFILLAPDDNPPPCHPLLSAFLPPVEDDDRGSSIVHIPSDPLEFLLVNGLFIAIFFSFLWRDMVKRPYLLLVVIPFILTGYVAAAVAAIPLIYIIARNNHDPPDILAAVGLILLIFCEIFYLKDNMGDTYFRMNTVFKCYLPAWIMLGIAATTMVGKWLSDTASLPVISSRNTAIIAALWSAYSS